MTEPPAGPGQLPPGDTDDADLPAFTGLTILDAAELSEILKFLSTWIGGPAFPDARTSFIRYMDLPPALEGAYGPDDLLDDLDRLIYRLGAHDTLHWHTDTGFTYHDDYGDYGDYGEEEEDEEEYEPGDDEPAGTSDLTGGIPAAIRTDADPGEEPPF